MDSVNILTATGTIDQTRAFTELHLANGRILRLDTRTLAALDAGALPPTRNAEDVLPEQQTMIPLIEEQLTVRKRTVETGKVRIQKSVQSFTEDLNEPLAVRTYDIERFVLNRPVDTAPTIRQEGETTIYPLVEEQLILTKQLILKEEVHVTRRDTERLDTRTVTLTREHLTIEREAITPSGQ